MRENRYCGPYALAHVAGFSTGEAAALFRELSGRKWIKGVSPRDMSAALQRVTRIKYQLNYYGDQKPTLAAWNKQRRGLEKQHGGRTWVIGTSSHYVVWRGTTIWDNNHPDGIHMREYLRRARVTNVWLLG